MGKETTLSLDIEQINNPVLAMKDDFKIMTHILEDYFNSVFASIEDPAQQFVNQSPLVGLNFEQNEPSIVEEVIQPVAENTIEELYETPTKEVEKKGLKKWFDKLKESRNPIAKLIGGKTQDNLLNSGEPQQYEDKPSAGRFDSTDTKLMPVGKGTRNSIIQAIDKINNLFRRHKKEKKPAKVIVPVTPKNAFNERYVVDTKSSGNDSVIIPKTVHTRVDTADRITGEPIEDNDLSI